MRHKLEETLEHLCEKIEKELGDLDTKMSKSDSPSMADVDVMQKLLSSLKSIKTVMAMLEEYGEEGYSGASNGSGGNRGGYSGRYRYEPIMRNNYSGENYSGRRGGYSRDSENDDVVQRLEGMMGRARSEREAMAIRDAINTISRME